MNVRLRYSVSAVWRARATGRGAFTLMELLVAVAILAALILIFGGIFSQVQQVVGKSNEAIQIDRTAVAIEKVIRQDISSISKTGFLQITAGEQIAFTALGGFESRTEPPDPADPAMNKANAALIDYGLLGSNNVLWRRAHLLKPEIGSDTGDLLKASLGEVATDAWRTANQSVYTDNANITLPPRTAQDWASHLAGNSTDFKVFWWDGAAWSADGATGTWSAANPDNWPETLRIEFNVWAWLVQGTPTIVTATTIMDLSKSWTPNKWANATVRITSGDGKGQVRSVVANTSNTLMVNPPWAFPLPNMFSTYAISVVGRHVEIIATLE